MTHPPTFLVLLYHNLFDGPASGGWTEAADDYMTGFEAFRRDITLLERDRRVRFTTPWAFRERGAGETDRLDVYITFDDGYASTRKALAWLHDRAIPAAVFVNSGLAGIGELAWPEKLLCFFHETAGPFSPGARDSFVELRDHLKTVPTAEREAFLDDLYARHDFSLGRLRDVSLYRSLRLLDWDDLAWCTAAGFEVGGHTSTHPMLTRSTPDRVRREIHADSREIERRLGVRPRLFAVPNGDVHDHDDLVLAECRAAGYDAVFSAADGLNREPGAYVLDRVDVGNARADLAALIDRIAADVTGAGSL
ncbi:polysaccharide deacetylase family protein [Azospirillum sp. sgz302134]